MPIIGNPALHGQIDKLDSITTSATATYALTKGSVAYAPPAAQNCIVSLNGVTQAPIDAFTINGTNIVFASALTSSDVIDYILVLGGGHLPTGVPSDGSVSASKLAASIYKEGIIINSNTVSSNVTIGSTERAGIFGDITIDSGVTVTVNGELTIV